MDDIFQFLMSGQAASAPLATIGLFAALFGLSVIDIKTLRLPDVITIPLIIFGLALHFSWDGRPAAVEAAVGAFLGYGIVWLLAEYWRWRFKRDGIGLGDAKLLAAGGAWCGPLFLPFILLISSATALAFVIVSQGLSRKGETNLRSTRIPFGPFLGLGIFVSWCLLPNTA